jgi:radical SAM protein with 4Fe4S-binding SPASM domain
VCGEDTTAYGTEDYEIYRKTYIGNIFQDFNLINSYTVYQNIEVVMLLSGRKRKECRERVLELIDKVGLSEYRRTKVSRLSGGQKQRVAIARALAKDAPIIVADEPTGNLDSKSAESVMETLHKVSDEKLVVIVTHNYEQAEPYVTRKLTMHDGKIIEDVPGRRKPPEPEKCQEATKTYTKRSGVSALDLVRIGINEGLLAHQMRTFLTMLGIIIGISSVIAMSSFSLGSKKKQADQIRALGANLVRIVDKQYENERLVEARVNFGVRTTVTAAMVDAMPRIVEFVGSNYPGIEQLHFEPVWECGRCKTSSNVMPKSDVFVRRYLEALEVAQGLGVRLVFSGARQDVLVDTFCKVSSGSFTVTPTGDVTACYEVSYASDPRSQRFFFGRYDVEAGGFVFDDVKLKELSRLNVRNFPFCRDCFCKWHCAGDCAAKVLDGIEPEQHAGSVRCEVNRALTLDQIRRKLDWKPEERGEAHG